MRKSSCLGEDTMVWFNSAWSNGRTNTTTTYKQYIFIIALVKRTGQKKKHMTITTIKQNIKFDFVIYNDLDMILTDSPLE